MFWIRIPLIRILIQGLDDQKLKKKYNRKKNCLLFIKNWNLLIFRPSKGHPSYRRSLQPSKENIQHFKKRNLLTFYQFLWVVFALLDPDPIRIWIHSQTHAFLNSVGNLRILSSHSLRQILAMWIVPCGCSSIDIWIFFLGGEGFFYIQHCFICHPSDSTVPTDAGIEPRTVCNWCICSQTLWPLCRSHPLNLSLPSYLYSCVKLLFS